jgi:cytochrome c-type biogenesis protein CcmH
LLGLLRSAIASLRSTQPTLLALAVLIAATPALAVQPGEALSDPALESRARNLSAGLRCLVCQNQSIDDSDAPLAKDLRILVRERLQAGDTDEQVKSFLVERYGEYVLLKPAFGWHTALLWFAPLFLLVAAAWAAMRAMRGSGDAAGAAAGKLSREEEARLRSILDREAGDI